MAERSPFPTSADMAATTVRAAADGAAPAMADDPKPQAPIEPQLEDCCGSGCVVCVFDAYEMARERYAARLLAWQQRQATAPGGKDDPR
jgi:hypothetical protein